MLLLKKFETARKNIVLDSVVSDILRHQGALTVGQLSKENFVCSRQMERLYADREYFTATRLLAGHLEEWCHIWGSELEK